MPAWVFQAILCDQRSLISSSCDGVPVVVLRVDNKRAELARPYTGSSFFSCYTNFKLKLMLQLLIVLLVFIRCILRTLKLSLLTQVVLIVLHYFSYFMWSTDQPVSSSRRHRLNLAMQPISHPSLTTHTDWFTPCGRGTVVSIVSCRCAYNMPWNQ